MNIIEKSLKNSKNPVIAFSGGKDSTVILDQVRKINKDILAIFCNTGVEHKRTYDYIKSVDNVEWLKPEKTYWQCVDEYGFPEIKGKSKIRVNACCYHLKEKPMKKFIKKENVDLIFTGITMAESRQRYMRYKNIGNYQFVKSWNVFKCHPILELTEKQVWDYIKCNNCSYNSGYDNGMIRCGCMPCTAYCSWKERLAKENFKLYTKIQHMRLQNVIEDYQ